MLIDESDDDDDDSPCSPFESNFPGICCVCVLNYNPVGPVLAC
jgi:hypothetical protein